MLLLVFASTFMAVGLGLLAVSQHLSGRRRAQAILRGRDPVEQRATEVRALSLAERWELAAKQAGLNITARTYITTLAMAGVFAVLLLMTGRGLTGLVILAILGLGPWALIRHRQQKRAAQFAEQLPAALTLAANTIRAGGTMLQAVKAIAKQMPDPLRSEFARVEQSLQLQVPLATALEQAGQRIGAAEFGAVVVAFKIAGQAGADLDTVLDNIAREIIEERQFADTMRAASSEGRTSAKIVTLIPFLAGGFFLWTNPTYFDPMLISGSGRLMLFGSLISIGVGWVTISRITDTRNW